MTVAVVVKVFDGIVVATDSATTLPLTNGGAQVYNSADKIFHLHRALPVTAMTWGLGGIGSASIATLAKDLRRRLMGGDPDFEAWTLDPSSYTVEEVAARVVEMFFDELFLTEFPTDADAPGQLGLLVAGYSAGVKQSEAWLVIIEKASDRPTPVRAIDIPNFGWLSFAQPEASERLFFGVDQQLRAELEQVLAPAEWAKAEPLIDQRMRQPVVPPMPFVDAIQFARFLVETTAQYSHFLLGPDTVGGVVEVAAINRHEGFRWISRKHYYQPELNRGGHGHVV